MCAAAEGWLQRVVILGSETHVIEEIQLFEIAQPVDSLTISHSKVRKHVSQSGHFTSVHWDECIYENWGGGVIHSFKVSMIDKN